MYTAQKLQRDTQKDFSKACVPVLVDVLLLLAGVMFLFLSIVALHGTLWFAVLSAVLLVCGVYDLSRTIPKVCIARDRLRHVNELLLGVYDEVNGVREDLVMELDANFRNFLNRFNDTPQKYPTLREGKL